MREGVFKVALDIRTGKGVFLPNEVGGARMGVATTRGRGYQIAGGIGEGSYRN